MTAPSAATKSRLRKALVPVVATMIFALAPLVAIEIAARAYLALKHGVPGKTYGLWKYDRELGAIHRSNSYNSNSQTNDYGFRNTEAVLQPKPAGAIRVIAYGGSATYGYNVLNGETWSDRLQDRLRAHHNGKDQVLNAGAIMWSVSHEFIRAKRDVPLLQPDVAILYTGVNEVGNALNLAEQGISIKELVRAGNFGVPATNLDQARWMKRNLALVRIFDYLVLPALHGYVQRRAETAAPPAAAAPASLATLTEVDPDILKNFLVTLERFVVFLQANRVRPVYVIMAHNKARPSNETLIAYSREGAKVAARLGALVLDAQIVVDRYAGDPRDLFIESGVHWTPKGAQLFAQYLFDSLKGVPGAGTIATSNSK